jgi:hypothetical protein
MIVLPGRSRRNRGPRQQLAGILVAVGAMAVAGILVLSRSFRGYPRGSFSSAGNLLPWIRLVPVVVLGVIGVIGVLRFARRNDDEPRDDADTRSDTGDTGEGQQDLGQSRNPLVFAIAIALAALVFGFAWYASATPR